MNRDSPMPPLGFPLDRADGPLYRQAAGALREAIASGRLRVGAELPREAELAEGFGVSLITIRQALRDLADEGLIRKRAAKPAVVASAGGLGVPRNINSFEDIIAATDAARLEIFGYSRQRSGTAARAFGLDAVTRFSRLHGRMLVRGAPVSEITIFFPPEIGSRLTRTDFDDVVVFRSVERRLGIRIAGARINVSAELADAGLARVLGCPEGAAILTNRILYHAGDGRPVELTIAKHRADLYSLTYDLRAKT
jgi:GntR family transcriptional regulator